MLASASRRVLKRMGGSGGAIRSIWGATANLDQLSEVLDVDCPVPLFDGATPTKVRAISWPQPRSAAATLLSIAT